MRAVAFEYGGPAPAEEWSLYPPTTTLGDDGPPNWLRHGLKVSDALMEDGLERQ